MVLAKAPPQVNRKKNKWFFNASQIALAAASNVRKQLHRTALQRKSWVLTAAAELVLFTSVDFMPKYGWPSELAIWSQITTVPWSELTVGGAESTMLWVLYMLMLACLLRCSRTAACGAQGTTQSMVMAPIMCWKPSVTKA